MHEDLSILEDFLGEYFHLRDAGHTNITIDKLTRGTIYNHENHYLIQDKLTNFNDEWFLEMRKDVSITSSSKDTLGTSEGGEHTVMDERPRGESLKNDEYSIITGETSDNESPSVVLNFKPTEPKLATTRKVTKVFDENMGSPEAVSYTHLDVYKRQDQM